MNIGTVPDFWQESQSPWNAARYLEKSSIKTSWASLPAKQAITVGSSSGFNVKLLHLSSSKDYASRTHFLLCLHHVCSALIHARIQTNKLYNTALPVRNSRTPASLEMIQNGALIAGVPYPLSPIPPFPFLPVPYLFRRLLRRLQSKHPMFLPSSANYTLFVCFFEKRLDFLMS